MRKITMLIFTLFIFCSTILAQTEEAEQAIKLFENYINCIECADEYKIVLSNLDLILEYIDIESILNQEKSQKVLSSETNALSVKIENDVLILKTAHLAMHLIMNDENGIDSLYEEKASLLTLLDGVLSNDSTNLGSLRQRFSDYPLVVKEFDEYLSFRKN